MLYLEGQHLKSYPILLNQRMYFSKVGGGVVSFSNRKKNHYNYSEFVNWLQFMPSVMHHVVVMTYCYVYLHCGMIMYVIMMLDGNGHGNIMQI